MACSIPKLHFDCLTSFRDLFSDDAMVDDGGFFGVRVEHVETVPVDYRRFAHSFVTNDNNLHRIWLDFSVSIVRW